MVNVGDRVAVHIDISSDASGWSMNPNLPTCDAVVTSLAESSSQSGVAVIVPVGQVVENTGLSREEVEDAFSGMLCERNGVRGVKLGIVSEQHLEL